MKCCINKKGRNHISFKCFFGGWGAFNMNFASKHLEQVLTSGSWPQGPPRWHRWTFFFSECVQRPCATGLVTPLGRMKIGEGNSAVKCLLNHVLRLKVGHWLTYPRNKFRWFKWPLQWHPSMHIIKYTIYIYLQLLKQTYYYWKSKLLILSIKVFKWNLSFTFFNTYVHT